MERIDTLVIGAGVVGLAVARALARAGCETIVAEAGDAIGQGTSSRNSEVIHAGLYYAPGSLKARLCVRGKDLLYAYCADHGVAHAACGKLVVATAVDQHAALERLQRTALANGVEVEAWSATRARALEPALACTAALWSPSSGIVDTHGLMLALQGDLERDGGMVALRSKVVGVELGVGGTGAVVRIDSPDGATEIEVRRLVNAAGLHACQVAAAMRGLAADRVPQAHYAKGSYYTLAGASPFRHLIYPAPVDAWLGVHVTLDLGGQLKFGPDHEWLATTDPDAIDYAVSAARRAEFEAAIRRYWPALPDGALQPGYSGVRPKIHGPGEAAPDFRIDGPGQHGRPGLVNLFGIESPGLTSALALAEVVRDSLLPAP
ncbi:MAG: NAD(P)/FAD-dependent oxidoreductase [Burkholderiales bacterium]|nr:NAD(P)/FAD-dependent oxidoreductase [Burkholderiales bacterium]MDE1929445.1 NAD(P)/FAD-dependent oxidoreductase [Burkholderiales bacterium]MDE2158881.1 NAD(P)/FAD-dependent oxidoreductase [Burkholderiales bacterium]MDE2504258.1 NAD(P)/FAD-dependent oxidoreductase [Burkholderiales bacterium]